MASSRIPALSLRDSAATEVARDALADRALYDGVLWRRIGAYLIDACVIAIVNLALHILLLFLGLLTFGLSWLLLGPITFLTVALAYDTLFIGGGEAATPGQRLFHLEVRGVDGERPDYWQAFLMTALFYATALVTSFLILAVALFADRKRTLHDILSGVTVVRRKR